MKESNGKKNHQLVGLKGGYSLEYKISATLATESQTDIFELMITDELVEIIVEQTNLYFQQNVVGKIFKKSSCITRYFESNHAWLFNQNDICLYIATLLYHGVVYKPIYHMY